jgi:hypothetical protein
MEREPTKRQNMLSFLPTGEPPLLFYQPPDFDPTNNWVHGELQIRRTTAQWITYIHDLEKPIFQPSSIQIILPVSTNIPNIWSERPRAAAMLRDWLERHNRGRAIWRRWLTVVRRRICRKRTNTVDLATCEAIPESQAIHIHDFRSRSLYSFHVGTLQRSLAAALLHQTYGFTEAYAPRNPYTNLPWSLGQICHIMGAIQEHAARRHRFPDDVLVRWRRAGYDLAAFKASNRLFLENRCVRLFFADTHDAAWSQIYQECVEDIFDLVGIRAASSHVFDYVIERRLPEDHLADWDGAVIEYFIYTNYQRLPHGKTAVGMVLGFKDVHQRSVEWYRTYFRAAHPIVRAAIPKRRTNNRRR